MVEPQELISFTQEIFSTMIMMDVRPGEPITGKYEFFQSSITGMVGLAGKYKGMIAIHVPDNVAKTITGNFLGCGVEEINEDVHDAIGELANMLGGSIKACLAESSKDIELSLPTTVLGMQYSLQSQDDVKVMTIPFSVEGGEFLVEIQLQEK